MDSGDWEGAPSELEQVAQVSIEDVGEHSTMPAWPRRLVELRRLQLRLGFTEADAEGVVDFVAAARREGRALPEMDEAGAAALGRLEALTLWARSERLNPADVPLEVVWTRNMSSVDSDEAPEAEETETGEVGERPSLAATPGGRRELRRDLLAAMTRQGVAQPVSEDAAVSAPMAPTAGLSSGSATSAAGMTAQATTPVVVPPATPGAASGNLGMATPEPAAPAPMAVNTGSLGMATPASAAPAPTAPTTAPPAPAAMPVAMPTPAYTRPSGPPPVGFQPTGVGVAAPTTSVLGTVTVNSPPTAAWPVSTGAPVAPAYTPRGAIPSYGGVTIGATPVAFSSVPPASATPSSAPVVQSTTTSGVPAVGAAATASTNPRPVNTGSTAPSLQQWWSRVRAQSVGAPAMPAPLAPVPASRPVTSQPVYQGGGAPYGASVTPGASHYAWPTNAGRNAPVITTGPVGICSSVKNAVDMINPFYSDGYTVERARTFWAEFERITRGMDDDLRMTVFRRCMKGKTGEDWWSHSRISGFSTLRVRVHNRFLCISPPQMMERLKTTRRSRGESVEEWADRICDLCDEASIFDPLMRYQDFLTGIRNSAWTVALQTTMVNSIEEAVAVLLFKNMQIPVERDEDFREDSSQSTSDATTQGQLMNMMQQMQAMMAQQQQMMQAPRSPRGRQVVAPVQAASVQPTPSGFPGRQFVGISMAAD